VSAMLRWGAAAYALLGIFALVLVSLWRGGSGWVHPDPWLQFETGTRHVYSALFGIAFGGLAVVSTRAAVTRFKWARGLHAALRPFARELSLPMILCIAALSAFGEELLFRGLLEPAVGVIPQAIVFGVAHQIPGPSRWVWVTWATVMGLALGAMFQLTGSLVGPLIAHAMVNAINLLYLKSHDPAPRHLLGGLLGEQPYP
jgi:uncharacterized protein